MNEARYPAETVGIALLESWAVLRITGDNAREWLNGQISNSVATARPGTSTRALVITGQGRIQAEVWVHDRDDALDLIAPTSAVESLLERFDRYIVMEDVDLLRSSEAIITVQGPRSEELLQRVGLMAESWPCPRLHAAGRDLVVGADEVGPIVEKLVEAATSLGGGMLDEDAWELHRVRAGIPRFGLDFGEDTYPREVGLIDGAVAFDKGCYVGQEAVVMLQHRGKPPRLLVHLRFEPGSELPKRGTPLRHEGQEIGVLTSIVPEPDGGGWGLGLARRKIAEQRGRIEANGSEATIVAVASNN